VDPPAPDEAEEAEEEEEEEGEDPVFDEPIDFDDGRAPAPLEHTNTLTRFSGSNPMRASEETSTNPMRASEPGSEEQL
jgi:hypothetical protein